ncbi:MAG: aminotransferase class I/II-fold pyridoxal phosphate-dependent enzyme [Bacillota bacterium]
MEKFVSQDGAPLLEELVRYGNLPLKAFHTPGHKAGLGLEDIWRQPELLAKLDLTEIPALKWAESLEKAEDLAAQFYKADRTFFLVQGASQGIIGIILGAFAPGDTVLVARNCHYSVINGIILAGLNPIYLEVDFLAGWGLPASIQTAALKRKIEEHPEAKGLILTNPTYQGIATPVAEYRGLIGDRLLIIDEAHGGYFGWSGLPGFDAYLAADAWIQGTHKMLGSLTQTGLLHLRKDRLDPERVKQGLELITTTSQSYILLSSLDSNRRFLATTGSRLFRRNRPLADQVKRELAATGKVLVLNDQMLTYEGQTVDPWKLSVSFLPAGLNCRRAEQILQKEYGIQPEYADLSQVTFFMAPWQPEEDILQLKQAVLDLAGRPGKDRIPPAVAPEIPPLVMKPREAATGLKRMLPMEEAIGKVSAAVVAPYPPGIPFIGPGELIRESEAGLIQEIAKNGGIIRGLSPQGTVAVANCG